MGRGSAAIMFARRRLWVRAAARATAIASRNVSIGRVGIRTRRDYAYCFESTG
jgi:hypothetical protein